MLLYFIRAGDLEGLGMVSTERSGIGVNSPAKKEETWQRVLQEQRKNF